MKNEKALERIKSEFEEIVNVVDKKFGSNYAAKNPGLVQHLLDKVQQLEDRGLTKYIHSGQE